MERNGSEDKQDSDQPQNGKSGCPENKRPEIGWLAQPQLISCPRWGHQPKAKTVRMGRQEAHVLALDLRTAVRISEGTLTWNVCPNPASREVVVWVGCPVQSWGEWAESCAGPEWRGDSLFPSPQGGRASTAACHAPAGRGA